MEKQATPTLSVECEEEKPKNGLDVPKPVMVKTSPCSSPYFKKLPPLSPRSMKMIDPNYNYTEFAFPRDSACSSESAYSSYDSGYSTTPGDNQVGFDFARKPSTSSNAEDIDFFLQVVGVFREYTSDQISALEAKMKDNQAQLETLQRGLKAAESEASLQESQLKRDVAHLISILHRRQADLCDKLKKRNAETAEDYRDKMEDCRRNVKLITGVLNFAKRLRNESEESLRENAVRELKQRLGIACDLITPDLPLPSDGEPRIHVQALERFLERIDFSTSPELPVKVPFVLAAHPGDDVSSNSVIVRWHYSDSGRGRYELRWWFSRKGLVVENSKDGIVGQQYTLTDLPRNCKVFVKVRSCDDSKEKWSEVACFRTLPAPAKFTFDVSTAHAKLQLSPDANTVFYPGDEKCTSSSPKSPSRFTFALNVLGNISFYSGRHYWEVAVNRDGWAVGVASRDIPRNSWLGSNESSWILHYNAAKFEYKVRSAGEACVVTPKLSDPRQYLRRVGVFLDYDGGIIRFVDCKNEEVLYTYTVDCFSESLCAAVNPFYHGGGLTLLSGLDVPKYLL